MPIYTQVHDFQDSVIPKKKKVALIQVERKDEYDYEKQITGLIAQALWEKECDLLILPQGTGSELLDKTTARLMEEHPRDIIVVCGSYIHEEENRCTILIKKGKRLRTYYQKKLSGKKNSEAIFCRHIFCNTGMGDFAVVICDDKVDEEEWKYLENVVDIVIFLDSRPASKEYEKRLSEYCVSSYSFLLYANQIFSGTKGNSGFYIPYQEKELRKKEFQEENIADFDMEISLLEAGRKSLAPQDQEGRIWAAPLESIPPHYDNPLFRSKEAWLKYMAKKEQEFSPSHFKILLERWYGKPKEQENWKLSEKLQDCIVEPLPFKIGRSIKSNLIIENQRISGVHAEIFLENKNYYLRDMGSTGKTYILKKKMLKLQEGKEHSLLSGEFFWLCKTYCFCLRFEENTSPILETWEKGEKVSELAIHSFPFCIGKENPVLFLSKYHGISKQHAEIVSKDNGFYLRDKKSRYGTYIEPKKTFVKIKMALEDEPYLLEEETMFCLAKEAFFCVKLLPSEPDSQTNKKIVYSSEIG